MSAPRLFGIKVKGGRDLKHIFICFRGHLHKISGFINKIYLSFVIFKSFPYCHFWFRWSVSAIIIWIGKR